MAFDWTEKRIETLKRLWCVEGLSSPQIAERFGPELSKNAVIGKITRLGLKKFGHAAGVRPKVPRAPRPKPVRRIAPPATTVSATPPAPIAKLTAAAVEVIAPANDSIPGGLRFIDRRRGQCSWPLGELLGPATWDMPVCGVDVHGDGPYCRHHASGAFKPAPQKRRAAR
ncbi:MAG: GcrA family cell cycle regulator [Caulobacteraceae bacterium]|nr:GcrA family cell cycle regulator [Caulobacteraceae bacterium]